MGRKAANPKGEVFHFRADAETAELILRAKGKMTMSDFLREAAVWWSKQRQEGEHAND
uniref:Uncharacterized protein n=1 Tax=Geobacter sp. (strain M21) TaxID=443144 RepID=C6E6T1_GEOSM